MTKACRSACIALSLLVACFIMTSCSQAQSDAVIIEYRRSGGIAGYNEVLEIRGNKTALLVAGGETIDFVIENGRYETLLELLDAAGFLMLDGEYLPDSACCDLSDYTIRHQDHTVHNGECGCACARTDLSGVDGIVREQPVIMKAVVYSSGPLSELTLGCGLMAWMGSRGIRGVFEAVGR